MELVEGKDHPKERKQKGDDKGGKTVGLLLRLCQHLYSSGKIVVLDSGFCVLRALIELRKVGVLATAIIKKRRYWPRYIFGEEIEKHMEGETVGTTDVAAGLLEGVKYNIFALREEDYVMKMMATYGTLNPNPNQEEVTCCVENADGTLSVINFKYYQPISNHFLYRHAVNNHNNLQHVSPSIEGTWRIHRWQKRVFSFLLSVTEVNAFLTFRFLWKTILA